MQGKIPQTRRGRSRSWLRLFQFVCVLALPAVLILPAGQALIGRLAGTETHGAGSDSANPPPPRVA